MFWFDGSVRNAVDKVKSSGIFLLVFVQGDDVLSKKYDIFFNEEEKLKVDDYIAIKISHDSVALEQFKQIYVSVPIPSVFLIQNNGIPLKVVSSPEVSDIHTAISGAIDKQKIKQGNKVQSNKEILTKVDTECSKEAVAKPLQHVRNIGRRLADISDEEIKNRLKEIRAFPKFLLIESSPGPTEALPSPKPPSSQKSARIQFRLPNNTVTSWEFPDRSTLGDVKVYLTEAVKLSSNFKLLRTYPRCSFGPQDEGKTLVELALTPSATLIVIPVEDKTVQAKVKSLIVQRSFLSAVLNSLFWPLFTFLNFFKKHVFKLPTTEDEERPKKFPSDTAVEKTLNKKTSTSNIHGFKFDEDTDTDTEHPDNGNSTQQRFQK